MTQPSSFLEEPGDTSEEIMRATYLALCEHGYSDLTIERIGKEFPKSESLLYHHYDSKDDILLNFLEFMLGQMEERMPLQNAGGADDHIERIVELMFDPGEFADDGFTRALVELRAQAAHDKDYREHFGRSDHFVRKYIEHTIRSGIEQGVFREVDPGETAALFQVAFLGTVTQGATSDDDVLDNARVEFERYVRECLRSGD